MSELSSRRRYTADDSIYPLSPLRLNNLPKSPTRTSKVATLLRTYPSVRQATLDAGAFGFLSKPFDDEVLLQLMRKVVAS